MTTVTVLGCGPSGLVAAHAAREMGYKVLILSKKRPSRLWGCQYLHSPIPGMTPLEPVTVDYVLDGSIVGYREKVYGPNYQGDTSPDEYEGRHQAWDLRTTYQRLWMSLEGSIVHADITNGNVARDIMPDFLRTGPVFSTIPRRAMCANPRHGFYDQSVWAMGDSDEQVCPIYPPRPNMVLCNGERDVGWYRTSKVFGYTTCEWPWRDGKKPPYEGVVAVSKPLYTDCSCLPEVHYVGRYGKWQKGYLVHHVFEDVTTKLQQGFQEGLW